MSDKNLDDDGLKCYIIFIDFSSLISMSESKSIQRGYIFRFYPGAEQCAELIRFLDVKRFAWNKGLEMRQKAYARRKVTLKMNDLSKTFTAMKRTLVFTVLRNGADIHEMSIPLLLNIGSVCVMCRDRPAASRQMT